MEKRILLVTCRICNRRKNVKSRILFEHAIGAKRLPVHNVAANHAIGGRKFNIGIVRKVDFVIDEKHDKAVNKKSKKDDYCKNSRLTQISQWRKPACHKHLLANKTARILRKCRNGVLQLFDQQAIKVINAVRKSTRFKDLNKQ